MPALQPLHRPYRAVPDGKPRQSATPIADTTIGAAREAINAHVGRRIRAVRIVRGKTQVELGMALGLSNQQIQKYEKGTNSLNVERLWQVACYLDIEVEDLLEGMGDAAQDALTLSPLSGDFESQHPRLRLELADMLHRVRSPQLLRGVLHLLRAAEAAENDDVEDGWPDRHDGGDVNRC
jgi:transcriptional regulator with XRE-family HTH domain